MVWVAVLLAHQGGRPRTKGQEVRAAYRSIGRLGGPPGRCPQTPPAEIVACGNCPPTRVGVCSIAETGLVRAYASAGRAGSPKWRFTSRRPRAILTPPTWRKHDRTPRRPR